MADPTPVIPVVPVPPPEPFWLRAAKFALGKGGGAILAVGAVLFFAGKAYIWDGDLAGSAELSVPEHIAPGDLAVLKVSGVKPKAAGWRIALGSTIYSDGTKFGVDSAGTKATFASRDLGKYVVFVATPKGDVLTAVFSVDNNGPTPPPGPGPDPGPGPGPAPDLDQDVIAKVKGWLPLVDLAQAERYASAKSLAKAFKATADQIKDTTTKPDLVTMSQTANRAALENRIENWRKFMEAMNAEFLVRERAGKHNKPEHWKKTYLSVAAALDGSG